MTGCGCALEGKHWLNDDGSVDHIALRKARLERLAEVRELIRSAQKNGKWLSFAYLAHLRQQAEFLSEPYTDDRPACWCGCHHKTVKLRWFC